MPRLPRNLPISSISFPGSTVITTMASADFATGSNMPGNANVGSSMLDAAIPYIWSGMTIFVGLIAVLGGLLYAKQDSLLYYPEIGGIPRRPSQNPRRYRSPGEHQVPFEELMIRCEDGVRIHSWLMLRSENNSKDFPTIVFFHGNAGRFEHHFLLTPFSENYAYRLINLCQKCISKGILDCACPMLCKCCST